MNAFSSLMATNTMPTPSGNKRHSTDNTVERLSMAEASPHKRLKQPPAFIDLDFSRLAVLSDRSHVTRQIILQQWDTMNHGHVPTTESSLKSPQPPRRSHTPVLNQEGEAVPPAADMTTPVPTTPVALFPPSNTTSDQDQYNCTEGQENSQKKAKKASLPNDLSESRETFPFEDFLTNVLAFRNKFNHVHIPEAYVDDDSGIPLGSWVRTLRQDYQQQQQLKSGKTRKAGCDREAILDEHRVAMLNDLGMDWTFLPPIVKRLSTREAFQKLINQQQDDPWSANFLQWLYADSLSCQDARTCDKWVQDQREELAVRQTGPPCYDRFCSIFRGILLENFTEFRKYAKYQK